LAGRLFTPTIELAFGALVASGTLKQTPEYFCVEEVLGFAPEGRGEHVWLQLEKRDTNTQFLASGLARMLDIPRAAVGYAGMKDRRAVTRQWFSIHLPGRKMPSLRKLDQALECDVRVIAATRSARKLRVGAHRGNKFDIRITQFTATDHALLAGQLGAIARTGTPNAFGAQRFGHDCANLNAAAAWFEGARKPRARSMRSFTLSAARAWLFNQVLFERVRARSWQHCLVGEWAARNEDGSLAPTGPMAGRGHSRCVGLVSAIEAEVMREYPGWVAGLERAGLRIERRRLISEPLDFRWHHDASRGELRLQFGLRRGEFATALLAQCVDTEIGLDQ
jgi:tRNA pseudouridine13 synthase